MKTFPQTFGQIEVLDEDFTTNNVFHSAELETNILLMRTIGVCDVTAGYKLPLAISTPKYLRNI